ncbi:MAG: ABC transporter ATP-binding protein, partial [Thermoplasmata archaeon]|nr:ABC transporter ATP-binding protein [Thermoplasmata archaeon]
MSEDSGSVFTISSKDVTVSFGQILALDNFSVNIPAGIVGLLGPNGAGKSTFIKTLLGLLVPDKGSMTIGGHDTQAELALVRDMIGYMPEHDCLIDNFTAVELVSYMGQISGMVKRDAIPRSHEVLDFVGIGEERYRVISSYSTGMKQRVKLAQAIVHDPKILFL